MKWFISDLHIDHEKVLVGPRGDCFPTIGEWQRHILSEINRCVRPNDHLFLLGDFAFKDLQKWRRKLRRGQIWLIKGNHDPSDKQCASVFGKQFRYTFETKVVDVPCWLSHYAHAFWPKSHHGSFHLYGHNHGQRESTLDEWMPERRSMEVCPEVIYQLTGQWRPINEEEVHYLLIRRRGHDPVEWYIDNRGNYTKPDWTESESQPSRKFLQSGIMQEV